MPNKIVVFSVLVTLLSSQVAYAAADDAFFEFAPRTSERLNIKNQTAEVLHVFRPQNDFLSGFDFWVDNPGSEGTVLFEFFDDAQTVYLSREVVVPSTPQFPNGTRFHVDFTTQAAISNLKTYNIRATTDLPDFHIYHSNRIYILQHDQIIFSEFDFGALQIGENIQDRVFKFALYETAENAPPVISNIVEINLSLNDTKVQFNANEAVDYKIRWGKQGQGYTQEIGYTGAFSLCGEDITFCDFILSVQPDTAYVYELVAKDEWGNETALTGAFISADSPPQPDPVVEDPAEEQPDEDTTPPVILNLRTSSLTKTSTKIVWTTDEVANSKINITTVEEQPQTAATATDSTIELEHVLSSGSFLVPGTQYIATATSTDRFDNTATKSVAFTTLPEDTIEEPPPPPPLPEEEPPPAETPEEPAPPVIQETEPTPESPVVVVTSTAGGIDPETGEETQITTVVTIKWLPPEQQPTDGYRIDLFDVDFNLKEQSFVSGDINQIDLKGLAPGDYYVAVYANNGGVFERIGEMIKFTVEDPHGADFLSQPWFYLLIVGFVGLSIFGLKLEQKRRELAEFGL